jgi:Coenzyme PQQ synthesis protein D (PqqD)
VIGAKTVVKRALDARVRQVGDRQLIARGQQVLELNELAAVIWRLADGSRSAADIGQAVAEEYEVPPDEALADVLEFLTELADARFLTVRPAP